MPDGGVGVPGQGCVGCVSCHVGVCRACRCTRRATRRLVARHWVRASSAAGLRSPRLRAARVICPAAWAATRAACLWLYCTSLLTLVSAGVSVVSPVLAVSVTCRVAPRLTQAASRRPRACARCRRVRVCELGCVSTGKSLYPAHVPVTGLSVWRSRGRGTPVLSRNPPGEGGGLDSAVEFMAGAENCYVKIEFGPKLGVRVFESVPC